MQTCWDLPIPIPPRYRCSALTIVSSIFVSVASKRVHVGKRHVLIGYKRHMFWRQHSKFVVGGCCRLHLFSLNKIFFARITLRIISGGKCAVSLSFFFQSAKYPCELSVVSGTLLEHVFLSRVLA